MRKRIILVVSLVIGLLGAILIGNDAVLADAVNLYAVVGQGNAVSGTATVTGSPARYTTAGGTITVTTSANNKTFTMTMCTGTSAVITSGTATISGSPLSCPAATATTVTVTNTITNGTCTIAVTYASTGNWNSGYSWSSNSGGVPNNHAVPTASNLVFFDSKSFGGSGETFTSNNSSDVCASMDWTGATNTPAFAMSSALSCSGSVTFIGASMTMSGTAVLTMGSVAGTSTLNSGGLTLSCPVTINDALGTVQLGTNNLNIGAQTFTLTAGIFYTNSLTLTTTGTLTISGSTARTFHMDANVNCGTWTATTTTLLTYTQDSGTLYVNAASGTFNGGSIATYGTVDITGAAQTIAGSNTFANLQLINTAATQTISFTNSTTQTVSGTFTATGYSTSARCVIKNSSSTTKAAISAGTVAVTKASISYITASGTGNWDLSASVNDTLQATINSCTGITFGLYWIAHTGNWVIASFSSVSAAATNAIVLPDSNTNVYFDANSFSSGSQSATLGAAQNCRNMDWTGAGTYTPIFALSSYAMNIYGNLTLISGMQTSGTGAITFKATSGTKSIDTGGLTLVPPVTFNGSGGTFQLITNNLNDGSYTITLTAGTFNLNGLTVTTTGTFTCAAAGILTIGSSTLNCGVWTATAGETLSMSGGTINVTGASGTFAGASLTTYGTVDLQGAAATISGSNTFVNLQLVDPNATQTIQFTTGTTQTVTGTFTATGYSTAARCVFKSTTTSNANISAANVSVTKAKISYITASGAGSWDLSASVNDTLQATINSCTGITFGLYWIAHTGNWVIASFSSVSAAATNAIVLPDSNTNVYFDAGSFNAGSQTATVSVVATCHNMDWTGATNTPAFAGANGLTIYGDLKFIAGMLQTFSGGITFASTTAQTVTCGLTLATPITFNGTGGQWTLQDTMNIGSQTLTLTAGTLVTNSQIVTTTGIINISGSTTRGFNGSGSTVTCATWTATTTTGLTWTAPTVLTITGATTFNGGSLTYATVNFNGSGTTTIVGSNEYTSFVTPSGTTQQISFTDSSTQTSAGFTLSGSAGHVHTLTGTSTGGWNIAKSGGGTLTVSYCTITYSAASPASTFYYDKNSTFNSTSGWTSDVAVTNTPDSINFGIVMPATTYYAYNQSNVGGYPNPVTPSQCYFTITNTSTSSTINISLSCSDASGGNAWILVSSSPTGDQFEVIAVYNGQDPALGLVLTNANQLFYSNLAASGTLLWDFQEVLGGTGVGKAGTFSDSAVKTYTITITGS